MIEEITSGNAREFEKRYSGTYGFLETKTGSKMLVEIRSVGEARTLVRDMKNNSYSLESDQGNKLEFTQVPSQWFNPKPGVIVYVHRAPERQWKRGICDSNTTMLAPSPSGKVLRAINVAGGRVAQLFHPDPESTAFDDIKPIECGLWGKFFAWAVNTVYVKNIPIGEVDHKAKTVKLYDPDMFHQEMMDALRRSNSDYKVVND